MGIGLGTPWLLPLGATAAPALRLFCFPPAGSGASAYRTWPHHAAPGLGLVAVVPPGRETRFSEAPLADLEDLISGAVSAIAPWAAQPFALFGHSLGALAAFEAARRLSAMGCPPAHLFVSGHVAPALGSPRAPIAHLPDAEFLRGLVALGGTPPEILAVPELVELLLPMLRADFAMAEGYRATPAPPLACPLTAFGGTEDPWVGPAGLDAWGEVTHGGFERHLLAGDHFYLAPAAPRLLGRIHDQLAARPLAA